VRRRGTSAATPARMDFESASEARRAISPEDEKQLVKRAQDGDEEAIGEILAMHRGLVGFVVRRVRCGGCSREDLEQQAQIGLLHALRIFDTERDVRFWTYARWWVRAYVHNFVWRNRRIVALSSTRGHRRVASNLRRIQGRFGEDYAPEQAAEALGVPIETVERVTAALQGGDASLDDPDAHLSLTSEEPSADAHIDREMRERLSQELVREALTRLRPRDREIVERRHLAEEPETLAAVGRSLGISRERVRQLDVRALQELRGIVEKLHAHVAELADAG